MKTILLLSLLLVSCTEAQPPCPPGVRTVTMEEADAALARRAERMSKEGKTNLTCIAFYCGSNRQPDGTLGTLAKAFLTYGDVLICAAGVIGGTPLSQCMNDLARNRFVDETFVASPERIDQLRKQAICTETNRSVDIEAEKHGLDRIGLGLFVPAVLEAVINIVGAATAPASFAIHPAAGVEEACVDVATEPGKKCTDASGCAPSGATDSDGGGVTSLPPGTTPGEEGSMGGDHL